MSGNFVWRDEFDQPQLDRAWMHVRVPKQAWADLRARPGSLAIQPLAEGLDTLRNPSFLARRQQHMAFEASTALVIPDDPGIVAGIAAFQSEKYWYFLGVRREGRGATVFLEKRAGKAVEILATANIVPGAELRLKIAGDGGAYSFAHDADGKGWKWLVRDDDGTILSTEVAGGFVGATVGSYARAEPNQ
jgi:alpha-N-arabinofuranosidase